MRRSRLPAFVEEALAEWAIVQTLGKTTPSLVCGGWGSCLIGPRKCSERYDATDFLQAMAGYVNLYHQLLSRRNLASRSKLVTAIYEVFLEDGNDYLSQTKYASEMMSTLNYLAADVSLDFMDMDELRDIVEEAKPPKGTVSRRLRSKPIAPVQRVISLGGGVQSTVMCLMAEKERFGPRPDYAIFADTGWEPTSVYETLDWLEGEVSFPIIRTSNGRSLRG